MYKRTVWIVWCVHVIIFQIRNKDRVRQKLDCSSNMSPSALEASTRQILLTEPTNWPWLTAPRQDQEKKKKPAIDGISFCRFAVPDIGSTTRDLMDGQADYHSACFGLTRESCGATEIRRESFQFTKSIIHLVWSDVTSLFLEQKAKLSNLAETRRASKLLPISS